MKNRVLFFASFALVAVLIGVTVACWLYVQNQSDEIDASKAAGWSGINAPYIQSTESSVDTMVQLAELTSKDLVYDLGCGDGRLVIAAVEKSGCRGVGIDIEPERIKESIENAKARGVADKIDFRQQDIFQADLSECSVALVYLTRWMVEKLESQFETMKPGSRIISQDFWIEQVRPQKVVRVTVSNPGGSTSDFMLYMYRTPLQRDVSMERGKPPQPSDARD